MQAEKTLPASIKESGKHIGSKSLESPSSKGDREVTVDGAHLCTFNRGSGGGTRGLAGVPGMIVCVCPTKKEPLAILCATEEAH